ncbi:MAG: hypothetical protein AB1861_28570 [Cyanobacteriota bacterium]
MRYESCDDLGSRCSVRQVHRLSKRNLSRIAMASAIASLTLQRLPSDRA